jgi:hypothetical protein
MSHEKFARSNQTLLGGKKYPLRYWKFKLLTLSIKTNNTGKMQSILQCSFHTPFIRPAQPFIWCGQLWQDLGCMRET